MPLTPDGFLQLDVNTGASRILTGDALQQLDVNTGGSRTLTGDALQQLDVNAGGSRILSRDGFLQFDVNVRPYTIMSSLTVTTTVTGYTIDPPAPPDIWGTPGGAQAPAWGDTIRLHVWLALQAGNTWTLGPHPYDRLDAGNCLGRLPSGATPTLGPDPSVPGTPRLWQPVECDVIDLTIHTGASQADGVFARTEAGTATIVLADPTRTYDPTNPDSPWTFQGRTRLEPGLPVLIFSESLRGADPAPEKQATAGPAVRHTLFAGTVNSIVEPWTPHPGRRRATIVASDAIVDLVNRKRPDLPAPVGAGDLVHERLARILDYFEGPPLDADTSTVTLAGSTMGGSAWALINQAVTDEIGFVHVAWPTDPYTAPAFADVTQLRFLDRSTWNDPQPPPAVLGCPIIVAATADALDRQIRNRVTAARSGGTAATVASQQSINRYGEVSYDNTGLGLADDTGAGQWASQVLQQFAFPHPALSAVTMRPDAQRYAWPSVLDIDLVAERVRIDWQPPDGTTAYAVVTRVVGIEHRINRARWEVAWTLADGRLVGPHWTLGPHEHDRFDANNTLG